MERSDRQSWTGDAHTSQAAALVAFGNFDFIKHNINRTSDESNNIESYSLYWILSLLDYYKYTGDKATLIKYIPNVVNKLMYVQKIYGRNPRLGFYGHDERLGATFENPNCAENQRAFMMLFIKTCREFVWAMETCRRPHLRDKFEAIVDEKIEGLRKDPKWYKNFGLHASADAVNAGFTTDREHTEMFRKEFSDPVQRISLSPFNQYFIIQALAHMGRFDEALSTVKRCWGGTDRARSNNVLGNVSA